MLPSLQKILRSIMNMFISTSAMGEANTPIKLLKIDVTDLSINKSCEASDIGMGAKLYVTQYKKSQAFRRVYCRIPGKASVALCLHWHPICPKNHL